MDFMMLVAFMGATAVCVIALVAIALAFWQGAGADTPVLLYPMLRRQSEEAARIAIGSGSRSFALAVKQCVRCDCTAQCRAWLESGRRQGFEAFCANSGYVSRLHSLISLAREGRWT
jgi:hypothetical protein